MSLKKLNEKSQEFNLSQENIDKMENGRLSFISKFPLDTIKDLSIDQYVQGTDENSFCYWLEFKKILFGIGGGNASKFGVYKAKDGNYYSSFGRNKKQLTGAELDDFLSSLKIGILQALKYTDSNEIEKIKTIEIPLWNMVLQKILSIYFPDKFITIGASDVLIECARDIELKDIELKPENSIQINFECKKALTNLPEYNDWSYGKLGAFIWESYLDDSKREYYILGSKYGGNNDEDIFPQMIEKEAIAIGFASNLNLEEYYCKNHSEITEYLKEKGEEPKSYNALKYFLTLKVGDRIAVKADGSPKGKKGFLSIIGIAEVIEKDGEIYRHDPNGLGHLINVKFIKSPVYKEFDLGGYGRTIHKLSKPDHIDLIFKHDYKILEKNSILKDYRQKFTSWLTKKYGEDSGTSNSYTKAIEILSQILSKELFTITDDKYLEILYKDLIKEQRNQNGRYFHSDSPSYGNNGFYSASIKSYREFLKSINQTDLIINKDNMNLSLNTILYGPPGTGKTYRLKNEYFKNFTDESSSQTEDEYLQTLVEGYSWWEVIAASLYDLQSAKVSDISVHPILRAKVSNSANKNVRATIWGTLQAHTVEDCQHVNYTNRQAPLIFNKNENSDWEVIKENLVTEAPEIIELLTRSKQYKPLITKKKRYVFTTFHQSFSYEDFIEGIKPIVYEDEQNPDKGKQVIYDIKPGLFKKIVKEANEDRENDYAIFIDEINRGNIANIFGELITLIEDDKRIDTDNYIPARLPYSNEDFGVPPNLYIIGTMNTADRSVEALDTALRRRFSFIEMNPEPEKLNTDQFKCVGIDLEALLKAINARIEKLLDKDYCIGHSYLMTIKDRNEPLEELKIIFQNKILPLLQEYFYGDWGKILLVIGKEFVETKKNSIKFLSTDSYEDFEEYDDKPIYNFTNPSSWTIASFESIYG